MPEKLKDIKIMADMLRRGATLIERSCPACSSPLFKLRSGGLWCAQCKKPVVIVKDGEAPTKATSPAILIHLESTILAKIQEVGKEIKEARDVEKLERLGAVLSTLLENLERIRKMKKT